MIILIKYHISLLHNSDYFIVIDFFQTALVPHRQEAFFIGVLAYPCVPPVFKLVLYVNASITYKQCMLYFIDPSKQHVYARLAMLSRDLGSYCKLLLNSTPKRKADLNRLEKGSWEDLDVIEEQCSNWSKAIRQAIDKEVSE